MNTFEGKKVLITGVNGFIGCRLAHALTREGAQVEGTSRKEGPFPYLESAGLSRKIRMHACDMRESEKLDGLFSQNKYDYVFHLASQADTWKSVDHTNETMDVNAGGTHNVLEAIRKSKTNPIFILSSSVRVFQYTPHEGKEERLHPYDASKLEAEKITQEYFEKYSLRGAIARNTNVYGGGDLRFVRLVPAIMKGIFQDGKITLKGDGKLKRDFIHVEDVVSGMKQLALSAEQSGVAHQPFLFVTEKSHPIQELVERAVRLSGKNIPVVWDAQHGMDDRDQPPLRAEETKKKLHWTPAFSLEDGLNETIKWYANYFAKGGNPT